MNLKLLFVMVPLLTAAVAAGHDSHGVSCETETFNSAQHTLTIVCPPNSNFSPIRVELTLAEMEGNTWKELDPAPSQRVEMIAPEAGRVEVRLPHREGARRWYAWQQFRRVVRVMVREDSFTPARAAHAFQ